MRLSKKASAARLGATTIIVASLFGCSVSRLDVSTATETAVMKDSIYGPGTNCTVFPEDSNFEVSPFNPKDVIKVSPFRPIELTVDAGRVLMIVKCPHDDIFGNNWITKTPFLFVAEPGHVYEFRMQREGPNCLELVDTQYDGAVISCEPYGGGYADISSGPSTVDVVGARDRTWNCELRTATNSLTFRRLRIDAGQAAIEAECQFGKNTIFKENFVARAQFEFESEADHTYEIVASDETCISLVDTTYERNPIACNPFQKIE